MSLKRTATTEGIPGPSAKLTKFQYYYVLESESEKPTDESSESEYSIQAKETDFAKDTSDTTSSDWSDGVALGGVEYDVASLSEKEHFLADGSPSSESDYEVFGSRMVVLCDEKLSSFADSSGTSDSNLVYDPELHRNDYWECLRCGNSNNNPLFRYCEKCYKVRSLRNINLSQVNYPPPLLNSPTNTQDVEELRHKQICIQCNRSKKFRCFPLCDTCFKVRKSFFPPRPQKRRRRRKNSNKHATLKKSSTTAALSEGLKKIDVPIDDSIPGPSGLSHIDVPIDDSIPGPSGLSHIDVPIDDSIPGPSGLSHIDSGLGSSQEFCSQGSKFETDSQEVVSNNSDSLSSEPCTTCLSNPKNGIFIHANIGHICCCYKCAFKVWNDNGQCPICNRKVSKVLKVFFQ